MDNGGGIPISRLPPSNPPSSDQIFFVSRIGNPETILSLRDRPTRKKFDVDLCALSPANKMPGVNFGPQRGYTVIRSLSVKLTLTFLHVLQEFLTTYYISG